MIEQFRYKKFQNKNVILLEKIEEILEEFDMQGIKVTLRQLYYQLVARDILPNKKSSYAKLSGLLTDARYNGEIDWDAIEDRVRVPNIPNTFENISSLMNSAVSSYKLDRWEGQEYYVELWSEKDALSSVIIPITKNYQVPFVVNRGYTSASSMYESAQRLLEQNKKIILFYLGDFDASGLDMDRDIKERLEEFGVELEVIRIGLTKTQIEEYSPPPNFAKDTDPRGKWFRETYGNESWEVDALRPEILQDLIKTSILNYLDIDKFEQVKEKEQKDIKQVEEFADKLNKGDYDDK